MAQIAKLFRTPQECKTVGRQNVIAISQEITYVRGMSLDDDGRQSEKGKTEHSTAGNSVGCMRQREMNDCQQLTDRMMEHAVGALTTREVGDSRAGYQHKPADSDIAE